MNGAPFQPGSAASRRGAKAVEPHVLSQRVRIAAFVRARGAYGATRQEIADGTGVKLNAVCGRVGPLLQEGVLRRAGTRASDASVAVEVLVYVEPEPVQERLFT